MKVLYVTGDTHGEEDRFRNAASRIERTLTNKDKLIICGDFGYLFNDSYKERQFLKYMLIAKKTVASMCDTLYGNCFL